MLVRHGRSSRHAPALRALGLTVATGIWLTLGACGSGAGSSATGTPSAAAAGDGSSPAAAGDEPPGTGGSYRSAAELGRAVGAAVRAKGSVRVKTTAAGGAGSDRSEQWEPGPVRQLVTLTVPGAKKQSVLLVDGTAYSPTKSALGKHWLLLSTDMLMSTPFLTLAFSADTPTSFEAMGKATKFTAEGSGTAGSDPVHKYSLTLGPEAAKILLRMDQVPKSMRSGVQKSVDEANLTLEVAIGDDDLPRTRTSKSATTNSTEAFSDWGTVTVEAPADDDVVKP